MPHPTPLQFIDAVARAGSIRKAAAGRLHVCQLLGRTLPVAAAKFAAKFAANFAAQIGRALDARYDGAFR